MSAFIATFVSVVLSVTAGPGDLVAIPCSHPSGRVIDGLATPEGLPIQQRLVLVRHYYWDLDGQVAVARLGRWHVRNLDDDVTIKLVCR